MLIKSSKNIAVILDDILIVCPTDKCMTSIRNELASLFAMKDGINALGIIGFRITRYLKEIKINFDQEANILRVLSDYQHYRSTIASTPMPANTTVYSNDEIPSAKDAKRYCESIGELLYIYTCTRPDIL